MKRLFRSLPFFILLFILGNRVSAQDAARPDSTVHAQIENVLELLENPQQREEFASQLRAVLQAKTQVADTAGEEKSPSILSLNLFDRFGAFRDRTLSTLHEMGKELSTLPLSYERVKTEMSAQEYHERFISFVLVLTVSILASAALLVVLLYLSRAVRNRYPDKWAQALSRLVTGSAFWASVAVWGFLFNSFFDFSASFEAFIFRITVACLIFSSVRALSHAVFRPGDPDLRLVPMNENKAWYVVLWSGRVLRFSLFMYLVYQTALLLGWPVVMATIEALAKTGIAVMLAIVAFQKRHALDVSNLFHPIEGSAEWKNALRGAARFLLQRLYILIISYLCFMAFISLLGFEGTFQYFISATLRSILLFMGVLLVMAVWRFVVKHISSANASVARSFPDFHQQFVKKVSLVERIGYGAITLGSVPMFFEFWGVGLVTLAREWYPALRVAINVAVIIGIAFLLVHLSFYLIAKFQKRAAVRMLGKRTYDSEVEKRVDTLGKVLKKIALSTIAVLAFLMVMDELGIDIKAMLAGVGILGLAVGFGAQSLVRDVISGLFIIFENRIRVGDVAIINGTGGLVEQVNLRTSVLRSLDGTVHVFPNGTINTLSNMTHEYSFYIFEIGVAYKEDTDRVTSVVKEIGDQIMTEADFSEAILEPIEILGVDKFADSAVVIKARIKTQPIKQWMVGREINRRIKKRFDELGIEIPFPHVSLYSGEASKPISVRTENGGLDREEIREMMREVLREEAQKG
ncbi:MAG: mechanosensitive ion channel family protein [Chitinispirillaceae bacterium]